METNASIEKQEKGMCAQGFKQVTEHIAGQTTNCIIK